MISPDIAQRPTLGDLLAHPLVRTGSMQSSQLAADVRHAEAATQKLRLELQRAQDEKRRQHREIEALKLRLQELAMATGIVIGV
jgi:hypothetical protein